MRYVLWSGRATGINLPATHYEARRMVDASAGWRRAVAELGQRRLAFDPHTAVSCLEVQSHGQPARLLLPDESPRGLIDHTNVTEFGLLLKPHMATGSLIELLACEVAAVDCQVPLKVQPDGSQWPGAPDGAAPYDYGESINSQYWAPWEADRTRRNQSSAQRTQASFAIRRSYKWPPKVDGLSFCLALAAASGAIVRASNASQIETKGSDLPFAVDTFGDWEGLVWDFLPNGEVRYLGSKLQRTQPVVTWRASEPSHNARPMTGLTADVGLRVGRPDRNRLPV